jgi:hypothetical protein
MMIVQGCSLQLQLRRRGLQLDRRAMSGDIRSCICTNPTDLCFDCAHTEESNEKRDKSSGADLNDLKRQLRNMESQHQVRGVRCFSCLIRLCPRLSINESGIACVALRAVGALCYVYTFLDLATIRYGKCNAVSHCQVLIITIMRPCLLTRTACSSLLMCD